MLRRLEEIVGCKVAATDGEIGRVKDVLFDEEKWGVRHLVVDTGNWLSGNQVLISPFSLQDLKLDEQVVPVDLTRKQIEDAPSITSDQPVSRRYEASYYDHYGWPPYWGGPYLWGTWSYPTVMGARTTPLGPNTGQPGMNPAEREMEEQRQAAQEDPYLHSFNEVNGYNIEASDGTIGDVEDIIIDDESWKLRYFVIDTSKFLPGKDVLVPPEKIGGVIFTDSAVTVDMTKEELKNQPEFTSIEALAKDGSERPVTMARGERRSRA